jgi:hypothetical protein
MAIIKKNFKVIGMIDKGNGIEDYPIYIQVVYELKKGADLEQVYRDVIADVESDAKRHFLDTMNVPYYGPKSIKEV